MLFNSVQFIAVFLPICLIVFFALGWIQQRQLAALLLALASFAFYAWDDPHRLLPLILASALFNYLCGQALARKRSLVILWFGVGFDLLLLSIFKYADFILDNVGFLLAHPVISTGIKLPIGISFFTFTQIAFLVDVYRGQARSQNPIHYALFVSFFPHLIAGPIIHHQEVMPAFEKPTTYKPDFAAFNYGMTYFTLGLFKKVVLADHLGVYSDMAFEAVTQHSISTVDAWIGTASYALQLYFDLSGYSDMAIGLAALFNVRFPVNFNSPYKAVSISDFWQRWHITLSRFLRDYIYIPLGGNRRGLARTYLNLLLTMLLGGLWHGAGWTFIVWGLIHGAGLAIHRTWAKAGLRLPLIPARIVTLVFVVAAWVPFRAPTLQAAETMQISLLSITGSDASIFDTGGMAAALLVGAGALALLGPNSQQIMQGLLLRRTASVRRATIGGVLFGIAMAQVIVRPSTFLYFRF